MFADNNLFNPQWTTGSLSAIAPIVQVVGFCAMCLISVGGFFMVILPLMRNVVNGIVVVAPNLCDKIDEAHRNKLGLKQSEGGNQIQMIMGSISMIIFSFFPNFKAMSDFDQGIQDPKSYMLKAIPMMCIYIFIGVFIFYGYPARFAEKFAQAGTGIIDMALNNVDPVAWIEKIPTNLARPDFSTNNATDITGKNTNLLSKSIFQAITSKYSAMSKENRIAVSHKVEEEAVAYLNSTGLMGSTKHKLTVETRIMAYPPSLDDKAATPGGSVDTKEHIVVFQRSDKIIDKFSMIDVPGGVEGDYIMIIMKFYEVTEQATGLESMRCDATIGGSISSRTTGGIEEVVWNTPDNALNIGGSVTINGKTCNVEKISAGQSTSYKITIPGMSEADFKALSKVSVSGIKAVATGNKYYDIATFTYGSDTLFIPTDTRWSSWSIGGAPSDVTNSSSSPESTPIPENAND